MSEHITHSIAPVFDESSHTLILGTMPSPKSREQGFYYGHPQNRFFPALAAAFDEPAPMGVEARRAFLLRHGIAMWDVLKECEIRGASDTSIKNPVPNDIAWLLTQAPIRRIFTTGAAAAKLYRRLCEPLTGMSCTQLPSPSPANCRIPFGELTEAYRIVSESAEE